MPCSAPADALLIRQQHIARDSAEFDARTAQRRRSSAPLRVPQQSRFGYQKSMLFARGETFNTLLTTQQPARIARPSNGSSP
ncbi:hypothetical protein [Burkholderia sola]|uniref:hypothetical protein n=1 Tax=Burkholderia sola TaxID=2843302 RepID=UPI0023DDD7A7|nr:hypothetical protein [Burkholderia sola]MDF3080112.1 hypothetical protein [Burkholderia sola]